MNRLLKTLLLWVLMAVLPLHALAASMGTSCGAIHHKAMEVVLQDPVHHDEGAAVHSHHNHHQQDDTEAANSLPDVPAADAAASGTHHPQHSTCSACSASCMGAFALPSAPATTLVHNGSEMVTVSPAPLVTGYIPAGLERPPRQHFA
jgi:hypothetical protein